MISGTGRPQENRVFRFLNIHNKIAFYPNRKFFFTDVHCVKCRIRWENKKLWWYGHLNGLSVLYILVLSLMVNCHRLFYPTNISRLFPNHLKPLCQSESWYPPRMLPYENEISFTCKLNFKFSYECIWLFTRPRFDREVVLFKHLRQCLIGISKHREEGWKYDAQRNIFDEMRGVWIPDETLSRVLDISSQWKIKLKD